MSSSVRLGKIIKAFNEARGEHRELPRLCIIGEGPEYVRAIDVLSISAAWVPNGAGAPLDALPVSGLTPSARLFAPYDVVIFVASGTRGRDIAPLVQAARAGGRQIVALLGSTQEAGWARAAGVSVDETARGLGPDARGRGTLEQRIVRAADHGAATLAAHMPAVRRVYCDHIILANAKQNGVIGVVVIIPGADMPAMTANQIRMVLQIAAAYGEEIGLDRALEILSVVGSAFAFRALARQALVFVPGFGWALKGAIGFSATMALGKAAVAYFDVGAPLQVSHVKRIEHQVERVRNKLPGFAQRASDS